MRFYAYLNPQTRGPEEDAEIIESVYEQAIAADRAGFAGICLTDHHFSDYNTYGNPFMFGAALSRQLEQAWIILTVAVLPTYNPMRLAQEINLLDILTKGRSIVALGAGGSPLEFAGLGRDPATRAELFDQNLEIMLGAWAADVEADGPFAYETAHEHGVLLGRIMPGPYRKPHPMLARGVVSDGSMLATARRGWPIFFGRTNVEQTATRLGLYRAELEASGHSQEVIDECLRWTATQKTVYLAETDELAMEQAREPLANLGRLSKRAFQAVQPNDAVKASSEEETKALLGISANDREAFIEGATIIGSPETVTARIQEYADAGVENLALHFTWGYNDLDRVKRSFELFTDEVMPRFAGSQQAISAGGLS
ncbi:MAG TPA: LLM class flavin-dependent oxidoreductase [Solirubrobacteraceae bacterium]|nr:LLM class flavin-dependent oxidoreductase [Solirubrobacteraceae bacterium]